MGNSNFDQYASAYDAWFLNNKNLLYSEVKLVAHFLKNPGEVFSPAFPAIVSNESPRNAAAELKTIINKVRK